MIPCTLSTYSDLTDLAVDTIIDVRAPSEFAEDHLPGAINLPVLDDAQRAKVGTIYKQDSPFNARKIGAALVAQNTAAHLQGPLAGKGGDWQPLVYCWRGGQRSGCLCHDTGSGRLARVGCSSGGYQSYRRSGQSRCPVRRHRCRTPAGVDRQAGTGTAKTQLLL